jgi:signal peptidase II
MKKYNHLLLAAAIIVVLIAFDHATKWVAVHYLRTAPFPWRSPGDLIRIQYAENTGAFLSLGANLSPVLRAWVMMGLNSVILAAVGAWLVFGRSRPLVVPVSLAMILSGGLGNLIDRIFRDGRVVDFMNVGINFGESSLRSGIFNVADLAIVGGLILLLYHEFRHPRVLEKEPAVLGPEKKIFRDDAGQD